MSRTYILLLLGIFITSAVGCATEATAYKASSDEIVNYKPEPQETIVVFPKNFREPRKEYSTDKDVETYLRYAGALDMYRDRFEQRRKEKEEANEKRRLEWEKWKAEEAKRIAEENERNDKWVIPGWWYRYYRYHPPVNSNGVVPRRHYYNTWWGWSWWIPNTGHRAAINAAKNKEVLGPTDQPTTRGTTITSGSITK